MDEFESRLYGEVAKPKESILRQVIRVVSSKLFVGILGSMIGGAILRSGYAWEGIRWASAIVIHTSGDPTKEEGTESPIKDVLAKAGEVANGPGPEAESKPQGLMGNVTGKVSAAVEKTKDVASEKAEEVKEEVAEAKDQVTESLDRMAQNMGGPPARPSVAVPQLPQAPAFDPRAVQHPPQPVQPGGFGVYFAGTPGQQPQDPVQPQQQPQPRFYSSQGGYSAQIRQRLSGIAPPPQAVAPAAPPQRKVGESSTQERIRAMRRARNQQFLRGIR